MAAVLLRVWLFMAIVGALGPGRANAASDPENPYWPCIQRKVPEISAGMVWVGPAVLEDDRRWRESREIADLVARISTRRMPVEEAYAGLNALCAPDSPSAAGPDLVYRNYANAPKTLDPAPLAEAGPFIDKAGAIVCGPGSARTGALRRVN